MNTNHVAHMQLAAEDSSKAFGPDNLHTTIAGVPVMVVKGPGSFVFVVDDREAQHDFNGYRWPAIVRSMSDYFGIVDGGR